MIVTTGRIIKIDVGGFRFERSSETPGVVSVVPKMSADKSFLGVLLPTNPAEVTAFIEAYKRMVAEDIGYRESKVE